MSSFRVPGHGLAVVCLLSVLTISCAMQAQSQTTPQPPAAVVPAPTPASSGSSMPAATPVQALPATAMPVPVPAASYPSVPAAIPETNATSPYGSGSQQPAGATAGQTPLPVAMPRATPGNPMDSVNPYDPGTEKKHADELGSTYIPVDSPIYPMSLRLYSLGYLDTAFISMRPWTRRSLLHMLQKSSPAIVADNNQQAMEILAKLNEALEDETPGRNLARGRVYGIDTIYTRVLGISGQDLRDSYHLGQTIVNDYGRPYEPGFNNITGSSTVNEWGPFSLYVRGEYEHSPSGVGYSQAIGSELSLLDQIPYPGVNNTNLNQATIPNPVINTQDYFRLQEATLSVHALGHEISGGKSDAWLGPAMGGAMAWSNNAEDIYSFRINRVEPLHIPLLSRLIGPLRYDFFVGSLKGHTYPNSPWIHSEMFSFRPTNNVEFSFQRGVIWGGEGHEPVTLHTFFRSFFSYQDTEGVNTKNTSSDPGARFSDFSFSWRLPFLTKSVTLYSDSEAHDDVTPPSAPRRAAYRPGVYISQIPGLHRLDFRVEGVSTDISTLRSMSGQFNYYETIQRQGYTNKGFILGDWIGREAKGGQAWLTYHLSGNEWVQLEYLDKKTPKDFIPGGTTQGQVKVDVVKNLGHNLQLDAWLQYERWVAPVPPVANGDPLLQDGPPQYYATAQHDTAIAFQVTYFPKLHVMPKSLNGK